MSEVDAILKKALDGTRLTKEDALLLLEVEGDGILALGAAASRVRERAVGNDVTYILNRNINFTNICTGSCKFCAFRRNAGDADAYFFDIEKIVEMAKEAERSGASELCIQGGLHPDVGIDYYTDMLGALKKSVNMHLHAFSPMEIFYASKKNGHGTKETLALLREAGLDSIPGTAAEILVERVRKEICPEKLSAGDWIKVIKEAHTQGMKTTATMLYGHVESAEEQVEHLSIIRDIQDETRGFTEFIPLSFVHFNAPLYLSGGGKEGSTGMDDLKLFAVSRLFLDNFKNIQASWVKLGRKLSQVALSFGANDLGGTLVEENISRSAGIKIDMVTEHELFRIIKSAGKAPVKRDTVYSHQ
ncbi:5-amino-6-(D-ribitylamino)uracil--L-tyrosine 4-hydroxyphenyl transferase CofH [archaeon]|nr:5-amino-6-(D-ribitylamino)uracil--L-tyrosine 4-hydroxyphenyl transferase CofH [archaeon]